MAVKTTKVIICDRCKKSMEYSPWKRQVFKVKRSFRKMTKVELEDPTCDSWMHYESAELCAECAKALLKWLETPPVVEVNIDGHVI